MNAELGPDLITGCSLEQIQTHENDYQLARQASNLGLQAELLKKLLVCQPLRGDLLVDSVQVHIGLGNLTEVLSLRQQLVEKNAPAGILTLVDGWIASSGLVVSQVVAPNTYVNAVDYELPRSVKLGVGVGYDTNPNSGTDAREIQLSIGGITQQLQLTGDNLPQASAFQTVKLDAILQTRLFGAQLTSFNTGLDMQRQLDHLVYIGQVFPGAGCGPALKCRHIVLAGAGQTRNQSYEFVNHRFNMDWAGAQLALSSSVLQRNQQLDSLRLGGGWLFAPTFLNLPNIEGMVLEAGLSYDVATGDRAGGDQVRAKMGFDWSPSKQLSFNAISEWANDLDEFSPALFGPVQRRTNTLSIKGDYAFGKTRQGVYNLLVEKRLTGSNIDLFSNNSVQVGLNYQHSLGL